LGKNELPLVLNTHCIICEYFGRCRTQALEDDNLSLLRGLGIKDIKKFNNKGIFTVNQLSYQFRPRRRRKRKSSYERPHSFELQALSIRENKIYVHEIVSLVDSSTEIYLDVESIPDKNFHYLIGLIIREDDKLIKKQFWANKETEDTEIFLDFLKLLSQYKNFIVYHFGNFEIRFLKLMIKKLNGNYKSEIEKIIKSSCNLLSYFYSNIYMPLYSNGLKDIGQYLGFKWSSKNASGIQSIIWRKKWELTKLKKYKNALLKYNEEDCLVLINVKSFINSIMIKETSECNASNFVYTEDLIPPSLFNKGKNFILPELEHINKISYFDYQRERVHIRTNSYLKKISLPKRKKSRLIKGRPNKKIKIFAKVCPKCHSNNLTSYRNFSKKSIDLNFTTYGIKKWIIQYETKEYTCKICRKTFTSTKYKNYSKYGHNLKSWTIFQHLENKQSFEQIAMNFWELFGTILPIQSIANFKSDLSDFYTYTNKKINKKILNSKVLYVDETQIEMKSESGYMRCSPILRQAFKVEIL